MLRKIQASLLFISIVTLLIGYLWRFLDSENSTAPLLSFIGWIATLLIIGYFSTPSKSVNGKIAFGFVIIMVSGIAMKISHLVLANEVITIGLLGLCLTYVALWLHERKTN